MRNITLGLIASLSIMGATAPSVQAKDRCNTRACEKRVLIKHKKKVVKPYAGWLKSVRQCEWHPGQRWRTNTGNGFYGAYQFTISSWRAVGGRSVPHLASPLEQSYRAVRLRWVQGVGAWPNCG